MQYPHQKGSQTDQEKKDNLKVVDYKQIADRLLKIAHSVILDEHTEVELADALYQLRADIIHTNYINPAVREHYLKEQSK